MPDNLRAKYQWALEELAVLGSSYRHDETELGQLAKAVERRALEALREDIDVVIHRVRQRKGLER